MSFITIDNMEFLAFHGCFEEERAIGTRFRVGLRMKVDTSRAQQSDNIDDTVNYQEVYQVVKREMMVSSHLLEHVAQRIGAAVKEAFPAVESLWVTVSKLNPPLGGQMDSVSVEVEM